MCYCKKCQIFGEYKKLRYPFFLLRRTHLVNNIFISCLSDMKWPQNYRMKERTFQRCFLCKQQSNFQSLSFVYLHIQPHLLLTVAKYLLCCEVIWAPLNSIRTTHATPQIAQDFHCYFETQILFFFKNLLLVVLWFVKSWNPCLRVRIQGKEQVWE